MQGQWINMRELQEERFQKDPAARERWERTALARAVAIAVIRYRAEHGLSQRALAKQLGMPQPHIARLELGEHNPSVDMLQRLANGLGQCFIVAVAPAGRAEELTLPAGVQVLTDVRASDGSRVLAGASEPLHARGERPSPLGNGENAWPAPTPSATARSPIRPARS